MCRTIPFIGAAFVARFFAAFFFGAAFFSGIGMVMPGIDCAAAGAEWIANASALAAAINWVFT
jgi:hypothetical protein